jgi:rRNA-processing protein FCF1
MKYMFDTNALNRIIKQKIDVTHFDKNHEYFITPAQYGEISQTNNTYLREKLLKGLEIIRDIAPMGQVHIHSAPWGHFPWGHGPWGGGDGKYYNQIFKKLSECKGNKSRRGDYSDALIIETCKMDGMTLITNDRCVRKVCTDIKVDWLTIEAFLSTREIEN